MRIAAVSDTHGYIDDVLRELKEFDLDLMLFAGDYYKDGLKLGELLGLPYHAVAGNCDTGEDEAPLNELLVLENKRIWLVHGHRYRVKQGLSLLRRAARERQADMVVFGHTHMPLCEKYEGLWLVNPGSAGLAYRSKKGPSWALIEIEQGALEATIISF